jgi:hypothetical protein
VAFTVSPSGSETVMESTGTVTVTSGTAICIVSPSGEIA